MTKNYIVKELINQMKERIPPGHNLANYLTDTLYMGKEKELKISQQHSVMQASLVFHWYKQLLDHTQYFILQAL